VRGTLRRADDPARGVHELLEERRVAGEFVLVHGAAGFDWRLADEDEGVAAGRSGARERREEADMDPQAEGRGVWKGGVDGGVREDVEAVEPEGAGQIAQLRHGHGG